MDNDGKHCQYKERVRGLQERRENFTQSGDQKILDFLKNGIENHKHSKQ